MSSEQRNSRTLLPLLVGAVVFIALGYLRDFIFVNINFQLFALHENEPSRAHSFFSFLERFTYDQLYYSKFFLTGLFTLLNLLTGWGVLYWLFRKRQYLLWSLYLYIAVGLIALLFYSGGYWMNDPHGGYAFARLFMGFLQSPVPFMLLVMGLWIREGGVRSKQ